jgi:hypothetical protein
MAITAAPELATQRVIFICGRQGLTFNQEFDDGLKLS